MKLAKQLLIEHLRGFAAQGKTLRETSRETGLGYSYLSTLASNNDLVFVRQKKAKSPQARQRAQEMRALYEDGKTLEEIGHRFSITRERVRQIMTGQFGTAAKDGGKAEMGRRRRRELQKKRDERSHKVWGCSYRDYQRILKRPDKPTYAYWAQRKNAIHRGIGWELNLWQWWKIWEQSGKWSERGRGRAYGMCRLNDSGPYAVDNVYIGTGVENIQDYWVKRRASLALEAAQ